MPLIRNPSPNLVPIVTAVLNEVQLPAGFGRWNTTASVRRLTRTSGQAFTGTISTTSAANGSVNIIVNDLGDLWRLRAEYVPNVGRTVVWEIMLPLTADYRDRMKAFVADFLAVVAERAVG